MEENKKKRGSYKPKKENEIKLNLFYSKFKEQNKENKDKNGKRDIR